ncbi:hypothetical protein [Cupriavidus sp. EM10]|uniref:hypothetical protein n=1 Tax=Cupriavidus sp. EM10 TaxID=2839983 RepID=UPI001BFFFE6B|nr:hypothetical protein [Cupriavidus sp. EM10]QWE93644.1 hypothetical protein KLP38_11855 [Cupriavidus sp. EM10]
MSSLTELIRNFQRGSLSRDEFLASVDTALKDDQTDSTQLARVLSEEHTRFPLPPAIYAEVMHRIDSHMATQFDPVGQGGTTCTAKRERRCLARKRASNPNPPTGHRRRRVMPATRGE